MRRGLLGLGLILLVMAGTALAASGGGWRKQPVPGRHLTLAGVSCVSRTVCVAVGGRDLSSIRGATVAARWNGHRWSIQSPPNPSSESSLADVACPSTRICIAVGQSGTSTSERTLPLAERWNGRRWSIQPTPNHHSSFATLGRVSCPSRVDCLAVGEYFPHQGRPMPLVERWNGRSWSVASVPLPPSARNGFLGGVSCVSAQVCVAVGSAQAVGSSQIRALVETWNGHRWSSRLLPDAGRGGLGGVSCSSASACTAVGGTQKRTLAERWNGHRWRIESTLNPSGTKDWFDINVLESVFCPSRTACTAVGGTATGGSDGVPLIEQWDGKRWAGKRIPRFAPPRNNFLDGVYCTTTTTCTAVGSYDNYMGPSLPLALPFLRSRRSYSSIIAAVAVARLVLVLEQLVQEPVARFEEALG
jgi:hypothetical protein